MMQWLDELAMTWQTGKGLSQLVQAHHLRRITYQSDLVKGGLERCKILH